MNLKEKVSDKGTEVKSIEQREFNFSEYDCILGEEECIYMSHEFKFSIKEIKRKLKGFFCVYIDCPCYRESLKA